MASSLAQPTPSSTSCECLPGYQLLDCLGRTPLAEVWKAQGPDGRPWAVKYIYAAARHSILSAQHLRHIEHLLEMRHAGLAAVVAIANDQGRLVLVTELAEMTLRDRFEECWAQGRSGIPRAELLGQLRVAAEALDYLREEHSIQHLGLNPRNLLLSDGRLMVADFGLVQLLWIPAGQPVARINPRYAPPEVFEGRLGASSDQYSLALIYHEMLTGRLPHRGHSSRQVAEARIRGQVSLDALPSADREAVARALHVDPCERFASCAQFVAAVAERSDQHKTPLARPPTPLLLAAEGLGAPAPAAVSGGLTPEQAVLRLVATATERVTVQEAGPLRYHYTPDGVWQHKCAAWLADGVARHKLHAFLRRWNADVVHFDTHALVFRLDLGTGFWERVLARRQNVLEVAIHLGQGRPLASRLTEVTVRMRFLKGDSATHRKLLDQVGPIIAEELHAYLLVTRERRVHERFAFARPFCVTPAFREPGPARQLDCVGKDISYTGIGFYTPLAPPATEVYICQPSSPELAPFSIPAAVTRVQKTAEGWYEAGARFLVNLPHQP